MSERPVFLDPQRPLAFLQAACAALAEALEDTPALSPGRDELAVVYAEVVGAYARVMREELARMPETSPVWLNVVDHLLARLHQVRGREIQLDAVEIAGELHARVLEACSPLV